MNASQLIEELQRRSPSPFLVIGGFAVIGHGYARFTHDLDLLLQREHRHDWYVRLTGLSYRAFAEHDNFAQFAAPTGGLDVDLMFVNEPTFQKLTAAAVPLALDKATCPMVSLEHLLALKVFVIKQDVEQRRGKDTEDVVQLVLKHALDLREPHWRELLLKHGTPELYERLVRITRLA